MNIFRSIYIIFIPLLSLFVFSCTELIDIDDQLSFEDAIVIEATITNEFKYQKILLTRTFRFEDEGPKAESNAMVKIVDNANNTYIFTEKSPGEYISNSKFEAMSNVDYRLLVTSNNGKKYGTANKQLTNVTQIDNIYASRENNSIGTDVISIFVDSHDPNRNSNYYRYEYEETYKIIAPKWSSRDFVILQDKDGNDLAIPGFVRKTKEERICYKTDLSNSIIQTTTTDLNEDKVLKFAVRNIPSDDVIISHRYSILVKQYIQSLEAYSYYSKLNQLSGSGSVFSQIQPGFINSNIFSLENKNEMVLGFFEITSVSEKRFFFNYLDFYPNEPLPPYFIDCPEFAPAFLSLTGTPLKDAIIAGNIKYYELNSDPVEGEGPYLVVDIGCGDCTKFGSNIEPDFWN